MVQTFGQPGHHRLWQLVFIRLPGGIVLSLQKGNGQQPLVQSLWRWQIQPQLQDPFHRHRHMVSPQPLQQRFFRSRQMFANQVQSHVGAQLRFCLGQLLQEGVFLGGGQVLRRTGKKLQTTAVAVQRPVHPPQPFPVVQQVGRQLLLQSHLQEIAVAGMVQRPVVGVGPARQLPAGG